MSKIDYQALREKAEFTKERIIEELKASTQNASGMFEISEDTICALMSMLTNAAPQLPQPAPVSVPEVVGWEDVPEEITEDDIALASAWAHGFNQCRAAMLQGSELETTTCRLPFERWLSQQNEPIDVDCGCVTTEALYHWLRVAYEAGKSPVIPDELLSAIRKVARIRADFDDFDGDRRGIGDCLDEAEQELIVTINKHASVIAAAAQQKVNK